MRACRSLIVPLFFLFLLSLSFSPSSSHRLALTRHAQPQRPHKRIIHIDTKQINHIAKDGQTQHKAAADTQSLISPSSSSPSPPLPHSHPSRSRVISLIDYYHVMYTASLTIGQPGQTFNVIADTGSSCVWVLSSSSLDGQRPLPFLHYYDHALSRSYTPMGQPWEIQYGVGKCSGFLSNDSVSLSGLSVAGQVFAEAVDLSGNFMNPSQPMDGILGLAFSGGACQKFNTFMDNLGQSRQITKKIFSFYLSPAGSSIERSEMLIGLTLADLARRYEENNMTGEAPPTLDGPLVYSPVLHAEDSPPTMWFVRLESLTVRFPDSSSSPHSLGGPSLSLCSYFDSPCVALPDTGTSFLTLPSLIWGPFMEALVRNRPDCVRDADNNVFCINGPQGLPIIEFVFEGKAFVLGPDEYMLANRQLAIQMLDFGVDNINIIILGDVFLRSIYTVFDGEDYRVGFAQIKDVYASSSESSALPRILGTVSSAASMTWVARSLVGLPLLVLALIGARWLYNKSERARQHEYQQIEN